MKMLKSAVFLIMMVFMSSYSHSNKPVSKKVKQWFDKGIWREGLSVLPDESVDKEVLYTEFHKNEELWSKAFEYLKSIRPDSLKPGRINLEGDDLYATVSEYVTKNEEDTQFEAHRKYADIQYVISGEEKMGIGQLINAEMSVPYNETKDVAFFKLPFGVYRIANPKVFFVFFPQDVHRPSLKISENLTVRKLVLKVRLK